MKPRILVPVCVVVLVAGVSALMAEPTSTTSATSLPALTEYTIHVMPQSHMDPIWRWRLYEGRDFIHDTFAQAIRFMRERDDFTFNQSSAWMFEMIEQTDPNLFRDIQQAVKAGRWCMVGGTWIEPDENLPGGEAMVRQFLYGQSYFREKFGVTATVGWNVDSFGHAWTLPQIMKKSGIRYNVVTRCGPGDLMFHWVAPDGSSVICLDVRVLLNEAQHTFKGIKNAWEVVKVMPMLREMLARIGLKHLCAGTAVGDHGGGPTRQELAIVDAVAKTRSMPKIIYDRADRAVEAMASSAQNLPRHASEMNYIYEGCYSSQMEIKRRNRMNEHWLTTAEKACSLASLLGGEAFPNASFRQAWKDVLFNQFHDILPGSSIRRAYDDAHAIYSRAENTLQNVTESAIAKLASLANTEGKGQPLVVYNPLSWTRTDLAWVILDYDNVPATVRVRDADGRTVPGQVVAHQKIYESFERCKIVFVAKDVPPIGVGVYWLEALSKADHPLRVLDHFSIPITEELYKAYEEKGTYWDEARPAAAKDDALLRAASDGRLLENARYRIELDPKTGHVKRLTDKSANRELVAQNQTANRLELIDESGGSDAWKLGRSGSPLVLDKASSVKVIANGPVLAGLLVSYVHGNSIFDQRVYLYDGLDRIDMTNQSEWRERQKMLKVRWPLAVATDQVSWEIPYGSIRKPQSTQEVPAQRWMDLSTSEYGVSLLNDGRYGHDCKDNTIGMTLLRSSTSPDPVADVGVHAVTYSLWPHGASWTPGQTTRYAEELNAPLMTRAVKPHPGTASALSLLKADNTTAIVSAFKQAHNGDGWIVRIWEPTGRKTPVTIRFCKPIASCEETNLLEDRIGAPDATGAELRFELGANEIKTYRVRLR